MADKIEKAVRSANMSKIKSKDTKPELKVRRILHKLGYRFRLHRRDIPGRPDIVLPRHKTVIFVNGCFWHRHNECKEASRPKTNSEYWEIKLNKNVERDRKNYSELTRSGWKIVTFWECELEKDVEINTFLVSKRLLENEI